MQQQRQIGDCKYGPQVEVYWAEVVLGRSISGLNYSLGRNVPWAEVCLRPK